MGRAKGSGNVFDSVIKAAVPTENKGIMSGPMRKPRGGRRIDKRGSRRGGIFGGSSMVQASFKDPVSGRMFGGLIKDGVPQFKKPDFISDEDYKKNFPKLSGTPSKLNVSPQSPSRPIGQRPLFPGEQEFGERLRRDREAGITRTPEEEKKLYKEMVTETRRTRRGSIARRMAPRKLSDPDFEFREPDFMSGPKRPRPLTGGYDPVSGVRYTDRGVPTAVQQTRRVAVQDPTLGGAPEREVPIAKERRQRITRESDPRGGAPFSPDERGMARDRFFERMFERADEAKQKRSMEREERDNVRDALKSERGIRESEMAGPGDERQGGGGRMRRRRRGRRRDFTRRRSQMEGGRRGRSSREMAEFRDRYVSTLR